MLAAFRPFRSFRPVALAASLLAMAAWGCGGGSSGGAPRSVSGGVLKGMVGGATVKLFALGAGGARGAQLGAATTGATGGFTATLTAAPGGPFLAEASGGSYVDEATGATVALSASDVLTAIVPADTTWISITPFTHMAAARALALAAAGTPVGTAADACNAQVAQQLGLSDLAGTPAIAATDGTRLATATLAERVQALVVAGLAREAADLGVRAIDLAAALALDLADGQLDGLQGTTPILVPLIAGGSVALPATAGTTGLQAAIDAFAASAANRTNLATAIVAPVAPPVGPVGAGGFYVTSTALPAWTSGQAGSSRLTATGGTPPYTCALTSGALPAWLALAPDCTLSGTAPLLGAGTSRSVSAAFTVTVTDSAGVHASQAVTLSVTVVQPKPVLTLTSPLPQGVVSIPYAQAAVASVSQGSPPFHYLSDSFAGGAPPPGLAVDLAGRVTGTPTHAGSYGFGICAVDLVGSSTCATTSLTVVDLPAGGLTMSYAGSFSGAGDFARPFPSWSTTCSFHNVFSGTVAVTLTAVAGGAYTGTAHVTGTWNSTATGGSTATFTCLDTLGVPWENYIAVSGTLPNVSWSDPWSTPGGSNVTGSFTGSAGQTALTGTQVETMDTSSGSASLQMTLPRQ